MYYTLPDGVPDTRETCLNYILGETTIARSTYIALLELTAKKVLGIAVAEDDFQIRYEELQGSRKVLETQKSWAHQHGVLNVWEASLNVVNSLIEKTESLAEPAFKRAMEQRLVWQ